MRYWARNRDIFKTLSFTVVAAVVVIASTGHDLVIPSFAGLQSVSQPIGFFMPVAVAVILSRSLSRAPWQLECAKRRPTRELDLLLCAMCLAVITVPFWMTGAESAGIAARNTAIVVAFILCCLPIMSPEWAATVPVVWILIGVFTGRGFGRDAWWNWPVASLSSWVGMVWLAVLVPLAVAWWLLAPHRVVSQSAT